MKLSNLKFKIYVYLYGNDFVQSVLYDDLLEYIKEKQRYVYSQNDDEYSEQIVSALRFFVKLGYISESVQDEYRITEQGYQFIAGGGFSAQVIKSGNDLLILPVAVATLVVAIIALVVGLLK